MQRRKRFCVINQVSRLIGVLTAMTVVVGMIHGLNYIFVAESDRGWSRILWHNYYKDAGKIEYLYLGSSHVYCDLDPQMLDRLNGGYNFNLASSLQRMNGTFYLLREADQDNTLEHVYVELFYVCNSIDVRGVEPVNDAISVWRNTDYMRGSVNKLAYMGSILRKDNLLETFLPFVRYRAKIGDWDYIKETLDFKRTEDYHTYQFHTDLDNPGGYEGYDVFEGQGKRLHIGELKDTGRIYGQNHILEESPIGDQSKKYLQKIIHYCQKRDIPITLFVSPMDDLMLVSTLNYDNYIDEIRKISDEYGIPFYDFNLTKEEYLPIHNNKYFMDLGHLNSAGAELFTPFFYQLVSGEEAENNRYFYRSYVERLRESAPAIYGIYYRRYEGDDETSEAVKTMWVASNREAGMEYRIILTPADGEQYMIQDFDENKEFTVPAGETGTCTIVARMPGEPDDVVQTMEVNY